MKFLKQVVQIMLIALLISCCSNITVNAETDKIATGVELVDLDTIFQDEKEGISLFSANNFTLELKKGNYEKWIDRIDVPDYAIDFYNTLVEYCDNDGVDDLLINDNAFSKDTAIVVNFGSAYGSDTFHAIKYVTLNNPTDKEIEYTYKTMRAVFDAFDMDHPEVFWLSGSSSAYRIMYGSENTIYFLIKMHSGSYTKEFDVRAEEYRNK